MYSLSSRASQLSSFISTATGFLLAAIALSCFHFTNDATGSVRVEKIVVHSRNGNIHRDHNHLPGQYLGSKISIEADLSGLFHWNTKQIFAFVVAEYSNTNYTRNEIVIWDKIIRKPRNARIQVKEQNLKYPITDITPKIEQNLINLTLHWDTIPWVGLFRHGKSQTQFGPLDIPVKKPKVRAPRKLVEEKVASGVKNSYAQEI
ncbi:Signal peptidase complex subunit [Entomophthora muscae]|uniref:Signal peptidase complex subunit n=1 Tax=Entomophthora muscae TaxID=34485 RepID=A0ACC2TUF4_9FUNG|nr:Signal peptidase complex subunit [Entomophthora muscae]